MWCGKCTRNVFNHSLNEYQKSLRWRIAQTGSETQRLPNCLSGEREEDPGCETAKVMRAGPRYGAFGSFVGNKWVMGRRKLASSTDLLVLLSAEKTFSRSQEYERPLNRKTRGHAGVLYPATSHLSADQMRHCTWIPQIPHTFLPQKLMTKIPSMWKATHFIIKREEKIKQNTPTPWEKFTLDAFVSKDDTFS